MEALAEHSIRLRDDARGDDLEEGEVEENAGSACGGTVATAGEEAPGVLLAGIAESINSTVGIRRKIVSLAEKEPYIGHPELALHATNVADLLMGKEVVEKGKAGASDRGVDRIKLSSGILNYAFDKATEKQARLLRPLIDAYGSAWSNDLTTCARSGTDFLSKLPAGFTQNPVHPDWQLEARAFPRLMSFLQKGFIIVQWMKETREEIAILPPLQDVEDDLVEAKTHLVHAKALEAYRVSKGLPAAPVEWLEKIVELLEEKKKEYEEGLVETLKLRLTQEALRVGGLPAVHWSVLPSSYNTRNYNHLRQNPNDLCMPDSQWPVHFGRDTAFFVAEVKKLVARVAACNVAHAGGFDTGGDKDLAEDHVVAIWALKKKLSEDAGAYERLKNVLGLPPAKKRRVESAPQHEVRGPPRIAVRGPFPFGSPRAPTGIPVQHV